MGGMGGNVEMDEEKRRGWEGKREMGKRKEGKIGEERKGWMEMNG
jgi:hypothetical protein